MAEQVNYDEISLIYDQRYLTGGPAGVAESLVELARVVVAGRVLEVGCGTGQWLMSMRGVQFVYGIDLSAGMLAKAKMRDPSLRLIRGTASCLPFRDGVMDLIFCVHALHHFADPVAFFKESRRLLRPGGAIAVIGMDPQTEKDRWYLYDYFPGTYESDFARYPSGAQIYQWMKEAGFTGCRRRIAARIELDFIGRAVFDDPILQKNGTSQLSLLSHDKFKNGMAAIGEAIRLSETRGKEILFQTRIALPITFGFAAGDA
jgi:ubiquinone/menaquinone biosynthesis C-methylase UbiE